MHKFLHACVYIHIVCVPVSICRNNWQRRAQRVNSNAISCKTLLPHLPPLSLWFFSSSSSTSSSSSSSSSTHRQATEVNSKRLLSLLLLRRRLKLQKTAATHYCYDDYYYYYYYYYRWCSQEMGKVSAVREIWARTRVLSWRSATPTLLSPYYMTSIPYLQHVYIISTTYLHCII